MRFRVVLLLCGSLAAWPAAAQTILGVLGGGAVGTDDPGAVVTISATTGAATVLGTPIAGESLTGVARLNGGRVVASTATFKGPSRLIEIDPATGALIQEIGAFTDGKVSVTVHDLTTNAMGELFGIAVGDVDRPDGTFGGGGPDTNGIYRIDPSTAECTYVGTPNSLVNGFMALAFSGFTGFASVPVGDATLYHVNEANGQIDNTPVPITGTGGDGALGLGLLVGAPNPQFIMSGCCEGTLFGNDVYRLDGITGVATLLGSAGGNRRVHDFVVLADFGPGPGTILVEVPVLDGFGLAALAGLLALAGAALLWRRG